MDKFIIKNNTKTIDSALLKFKLAEFRPLQRVYSSLTQEIIQANLDKRDILVLINTGGGKSLTFQLPATIQKGVTLVVSPLLALIQNQVDHLKSLGINVESLNSTTGTTKKQAILKDLTSKSPLVKLLYVTPELLSTDYFKSILEKVYQNDMFCRLVIDECHLISEWGHDFRSDYQRIGYYKQKYPNLPIMALTATATKRVLDDIVKSLKLSDPSIFKSDFARKNLHLEVRFKGIDNDPTADVLKLLKNIYTSRRKRLGNCSEERIQGVCGIIYCSTRAQCDLVTEALKANKINAASYHAGLTQKQRNLILSSWSNTTTTVKKNFQQKTLNQIISIDESKDPTKPCDEIIDIVVATISFGMGIDKSCVRFVIHWDMPKTIEGYYQESGRAGRDGKTSRCILYYSKSDCDRILYLQSQQSKNRAHKFNEQQSFDKLIEYCENTKHCRHGLLEKYFIGNEVTSCKTSCDVCKNAKKVLEMKTNYDYHVKNIPRDSISTEFKSAKEYSDAVYLKDGSVASFHRSKRSYDTFLQGEEMDKPTFKSAKFVYDREYFTGKKSKASAESKPSKSLYGIHHNNQTIPGLTTTMRDSSFLKIKSKLKGINDDDELVTKLALEHESRIFLQSKLGVVYQNKLVKLLSSDSATLL